MKTTKKIFFNSICTPLEHPDSPQSLYLWAFSQFSPLLKLVSQEFYSDNFNSTFAIFGRYIRHIRRHIFTVIKIVLKTYSCIKPIIYSDIQKLSLVIAFVPEFFYQLLKPFHGHFTIHFVPIFLLKQQHFMY